MLTVFHDNFHSGFYLPATDLPFDMQMDSRAQRMAGPELLSADPDRTEIVEVGFSNLDWVLHENRTCWKVARLLFFPDDGTLLVTNLHSDTYQQVRTNGKVWRIPLSEARYKLFLSELLSWVDPGAPSYVAQLGDIRAECYASKYSYALRSNCHDWTSHMLCCAGIPMAWRLYRKAEDLREDLDSALQAIEAPR